MAEAKLGPGKKRYTLSLKQVNVERFQSLCRDFGMPSNTMSNVLDDTLQGLCEMFQEAKDRGTMSITDIFRLMGKQVELLIEEEKKEVTTNAKTQNAGKTARTNKQAAR